MGESFVELEREGMSMGFVILFVVVKRQMGQHTTRVPGQILDKFCVVKRNPKNNHPVVKMKPGIHPRRVLEAMLEVKI